MLFVVKDQLEWQQNVYEQSQWVRREDCLNFLLGILDSFVRIRVNRTNR